MLEQDYIMRIILQYAQIIRRSWTKAGKGDDPLGAAELIENQVGEATEIDGNVLLSLAPESIAGVMQVSGTDPQIADYISRSLLLEAQYLREANKNDTAELREAQAYAIAEAFGIELSLEAITEEEWEELFAKSNPEKGTPAPEA
ncbi:MAG: hypothetical protein ACOYD7_01160 [Raoultibacter sp.]|jgi:hypothetical protein